MLNKRRIRRLVVACGLLLIAVAIIYGAAGSSFFDPSSGRQSWPVQFQSNGERIYFTASSASGISDFPLSLRPEMTNF